MKRLTALLVDDEVVMCEALRRIIEKNPYTEVIGTCHDGEDALAMIKEMKPDLVFLDIRMPGMSGLEVASILDKIPNAPAVIFVTAFDEFAVKAFEANALDYILKPFDEADINRVMRKVKRFGWQEHPAPARVEQFPGKFCVYQGDRMKVIESSEIKYISVENRNVVVQTVDGQQFTSKLTLQELENKLDPSLFFRCHRNYIVNMDQVKEISPWFNRGFLLLLKGEKKSEVPVSRTNVPRLQQYIQF